MNLRSALGIHAADAAAAAVEIAHQIAGVFYRSLHLDVHDRLQQRGLASCHGSFERLAGCKLERHFRGVDIVIGTVVNGHLEIDHRKAGQVTARGGFEDAFLNRRDVLPGNRPAEDLVAELETFPPRGSGSMRIQQSPNWP